MAGRKEVTGGEAFLQNRQADADLLSVGYAHLPALTFPTTPKQKL